MSIRKYVLNKEKINEKHLLRLNESKFALFISKKLKQELESINITGCEFSEIKVK